MNRRTTISNGAVSILVARIVYAVNWFNIGSLFPFISKEFNQDVSYLGQLSGFFLLGIGLFQIPGGLFCYQIWFKKKCDIRNSLVFHSRSHIITHYANY